jgi:hypothetical protein
MRVNDDRLTKEELQYLIEELSLSDDEPADNEEKPLEPTVLGALQSGLKNRLQRRVQEMRERNEEVSANLLDLIERL